MQLQVEHTTVFAYDSPIAESYTELRLRPLDQDGQRCLSFSVETEPRGVPVRVFQDHLGNTVGGLEVLEPHDRLVVTARSAVETSPFEERTPPTPLERFDYLAPSGHVNLDQPFSIDATERPGANDLMNAVAEALVYEKGVSSVQTSAREALALGRGVCQDFAHVLIAACRLAGIPARYVSGYLHDDLLPREQGATHAWVDAWDDDRGWISLDPTHRREQNESYIRVAVGRDYGDVPPTRGVYKGPAAENLSVVVAVEPSSSATA